MVICDGYSLVHRMSQKVHMTARDTYLVIGLSGWASCRRRGRLLLTYVSSRANNFLCYYFPRKLQFDSFETFDSVGARNLGSIVSLQRFWAQSPPGVSLLSPES